MKKPMLLAGLAFLFATQATAADTKYLIKTPPQKLSSGNAVPTNKALKLDLRKLREQTAQQRLVDCVAQGKSGDCDGDGSESYNFGGNDCDDADPNRYPGNIEVADDRAHDEDCDYTTYGFRDSDGDGFGDIRAANYDNQGKLVRGEDCNDNRRSVHPNAPEVCNHIDDNCDGAVDDLVQVTLYRDADKDGFGDPATRFMGCHFDLRAGVVANDSDCDDKNARRNPIGGC